MTDATAMDAARLRYIAEYPNFVAAAARAQQLVDELVQQQGVTQAHIKVRAKEIASFVKKLRKYGDDCWERTTDKVGAQISTRTTAEARRLRSCLEAGVGGMAYLETTDKSTFSSDPRQLRYSGVHVQVRLEGCMTSDGEPIECEIQLRTQTQDIWASLEHALVYKPDLELPGELQRKVLRLSVLVEMFDEEVETVIAHVEQDRRHRSARLLRQAERWFLTIVSDPGEKELSLEVLDAIMSSFSDDEISGYAETLERFVDANRDKIHAALMEYGQGSSYSEQFNYFLFTQPESLVIWERLEARAVALSGAVRGSDIETAVEALADVWGRPLPL